MRATPFHILSRLVVGLLLIGAPMLDRFVAAESTGTLETRSSSEPDSSANREANKAILVEIFLSREHADDLDAVKKAFAAASITKVRPQLFRLGNPPENIAIGRNITAPVARLAIQLAVTYNRGISHLLAEERLAPDYLAIGTSIFDESYQIPISPDDLKRLSDPSLTTPQFHALYRHLTKEDQRPN
jgi:hypothetical protein